MSCKKIERLIQEYVDGGASAPQRAKVEAHVLECPRCARTLAETRALVGLLSGTTARRTSDGFECRLAAALAETVPASSTRAWWERWQWRFEWRLRMPALVAAGSLGVGLIAAVVVPQLLPERRDSTDVRREYLAAAVQRHQQLARSSSEVDWDAVDASIELNTGDVVTD